MYFDISTTNKERIIHANSLLNEDKYVLAGLISAIALESIIEDLFEKNHCREQGVIIEGLEPKIDTICEKISLSGKLKDELHHIRKCRNAIVHNNSKLKLNRKRNSLTCEHELLKIIVNIFKIEVEINYEEKARIEEVFYPGSWIKIGGNLPKELKTEYFANLKNAAIRYMAPLGHYLTNNCLNTLDSSLEFQKISRVDYTSGYVWLSAVKTKCNESKYRSRVALPGLTVVLKPTGIQVYIELPGKAIKYKKIYYEQLLSQKELRLLLNKSPKLKIKSYIFFHTWWFADIEFIENDTSKPKKGLVNTYLSQSRKKSNENNLRKKWNFEELIKERIGELNQYNDIDPISPALTRNSFLIGRFYSRDECLNKYSYNLHEKISEDFKVLYPVLQELYVRGSK